MEKPRIITPEDQWFSYIASLLEEIRDLLKESQSTADIVPDPVIPEQVQTEDAPAKSWFGKARSNNNGKKL